MLTGEIKQELINVLQPMIANFQRARAAVSLSTSFLRVAFLCQVTDDMVKAFMAVRQIRC